MGRAVLLLLLWLLPPLMRTAAAAPYDPVDPGGTDIFTHGEAGFPCWRVPAVVLAPPTGLLFAFAEARNGSGGDGCIPHTPAGLACLKNTSALHHCNMNPGPRSLALKTSSDSGNTWGNLRIVDYNGLNPAVLYDAKSERVIVHYPAAYELPMPHPKIGGTHLKQMICTPAGVCGAPTSLEHDLSWKGGAPLGPPGPFVIGAGPGLGVQLTMGPHAGRLLFSGHAGQVDVTWYSDNSGKSWTLSQSLFGNNNKSNNGGCEHPQGCYDEPFPIQLPMSGIVQINMRNDSATCSPKTCGTKWPTRLKITHPRSVADSTDVRHLYGSRLVVPTTMADTALMLVIVVVAFRVVSRLVLHTRWLTSLSQRAAARRHRWSWLGKCCSLSQRAGTKGDLISRYDALMTVARATLKRSCSWLGQEGTPCSHASQGRQRRRGSATTRIVGLPSRVAQMGARAAHAGSGL